MEIKRKLKTVTRPNYNPENPNQQWFQLYATVNLNGKTKLYCLGYEPVHRKSVNRLNNVLRVLDARLSLQLEREGVPNHGCRTA